MATEALPEEGGWKESAEPPVDPAPEPQPIDAAAPVGLEAVEEPTKAAGLTEATGLTNGNGPKGKASEFGRNHRSGAREGPGFLFSPGLTNGGGRTNGTGRVNGGRVNGGRVNGGRVNGGRVNGGRVNGGRVNGGRVNGGRVNGGRVNGGRVNGGRVNGGRVNGGRVNGGRVNGGRVNGGRVNGNGTILSERILERRRRSTRMTAVLLAFLLFGLTLITPLLLSGVFPQPPIVIDGTFTDWAGRPVFPDSPDDSPQNADINFVAFTSVQTERDLYFYAQMTPNGRPFSPPPSPQLAEMVRLYIDIDRDQSTGFLAYGLGADYLVELTGYSGALRSSSFRLFPASAQDRTNADLFETAGGVRAIARGNQIEGSVPLGDTRTAAARPSPFLLFDAVDSAGNEDLGDEVFSSRPGVLILSQSPANETVLPNDRESLLLTVEGRALHQNITLVSLILAVDGSGGGGVTLTHANVGGRNITLNATGSAGGTVRADLSSAAPFVFAPGAAPSTITIFGRPSGAPAAATLRLAVNGSQFGLTGAPPAGTSGHASAFPPFSFERAYLGAAPDRIVIDGAFADWVPVGAPHADPDNDIVQGIPPTPTNASPPRGPIDQSIDIRALQADVNTGPAEVSFYLAVDGSIFPGRLPALPSLPQPQQPPPTGGGGGGGGPPQAPGVDGDLATIYLDTDLDPTTGWLALPGLGVDAVVQVWGSGGGLGRAPAVAATTVSLWQNFTQSFNKTTVGAAVGLSSSKMEAQVPASAICPGACALVRYAYSFQQRAGAFDVAGPQVSNLRGDGAALLFDETPPTARVAIAGDNNAPVLVVALSSPGSNTRVAQLSALLVQFTGPAASSITRVALYRDRAQPGALDASDIAAGAVAEATLEPGALARLVPYTALILNPGDRLDAIVAVDLPTTAASPSFLNGSVAEVLGVRSIGIVDVRYGLPNLNGSIHVLPPGSPGRGQNNVVVNEVNFVSGFIEFYDTSGGTANFTSPSIMGFTVYRTNTNGNNIRIIDVRRLTGTTNAEGFAAYNYSVPLSTATVNYYVGLWCSNCTAGQGPTGSNNATYVDYMQMPRFTSNGSWGRYPDGNAQPLNTTNNTFADNNQLPGNNSTTPPSGQNNLIINEASIVGSWVEVYATHGATTSLTNPSLFGIEVYYTNANGANHVIVSVRNFSGSTNAEGFAAINVSVPLSTATRRYHVALWCSNCTAGQDFRGRDNRTYVDDVEIPRSTANGTWGRFPDANDVFQNTTNNTRADNNEIPEFGDLVLPIGGAALIALAFGRRKRAAPSAEPPPRPAP